MLTKAKHYSFLSEKRCLYVRRLNLQLFGGNLSIIEKIIGNGLFIIMRIVSILNKYLEHAI